MALRLAAGTLAPLERRAIERRLDECELCRRFVAEVLRHGGVTADPARGPAAPAASAGAGRGPSRGAAPAGQAAGPAAPASTPTLPASPMALAQASAERAAEPRGLGLPLPGERIDRYVIERPLGAGGMGMVSLALDEDLKRHVVIKLVRPDLVQRQESGAPSALEVRLLREAQALARLSHPNVVAIFDIGRYRGQVFFAMEYVAGEDLSTYLARGHHPLAELLALFTAAGAGLAAAHRAQVVHRDFKPANVLLGEGGVVKVADFGLARGVASAPEPAAPPARGAGRSSSLLDAALTLVDRTVGTPAYMAPEQIAGEGVDARSDQFAFAVALIDAVLGQPPSARLVHPQTADAAARATLAEALVQRGLAPRKAGALLRALAPAPDQRWPSLDGLLEELTATEPVLAPPPSGASPPEARVAPPRPASSRWRWPVAALGLAAVALGLWAATRSQGAPVAPECPEQAGVAAALDAPRRAALLTSASGAAAFSSWTAAAAVDALATRLGVVAAAHQQRCQGKAPEGCAPTSAEEVRRQLAAVRGLPEVLALSGRLRACDAALGAPSARGVELLQRAHRQLLGGELGQARTLAAEAAVELSDAPLLGSEAWAVAARAALWAGHPEAADLAAKVAADAERAGDDGRRAEALLLELETAVLLGDGARAERASDMLTSLVSRRGQRAGERARVQLVAAMARAALGSPSPARFREAAELARGADEPGLAELAEVGAEAADLAIDGYARRAKGQPPRHDLGGLTRYLTADRWRDGPRLEPTGAQLAALGAALELGAPLPPQVLRTAAAALATAPPRAWWGVGPSLPELRGRLRARAALEAGLADLGWLEREVAAELEGQRVLEAAWLALELASRGGADPELAPRALRRGRGALFNGSWPGTPSRPPARPMLAAALAELALIDAGALQREGLLFARSSFEQLPADSLQRAEAAWLLASHSRTNPSYLQAEEELEVAIPLWQALGAEERAATVAWWIAQASPYPRPRARRHAELARAAFHRRNEQALVADIDAWLAANPAN